MNNYNLVPQPPVLIRKASIEDAESIIIFLNEVAGETDFLTFGINQFTVSLEEEKAIISECLTIDQELMLIATNVDGIIVAQLFLTRSKKERLLHVGEIGIAVSKKYWGQSIGAEMISQAIKWSQEKNLRKIQLQVRADNNRAVKLYQKLGFVIEGKLLQSIKIADEYFDEYIMGILI